MKTGGFRHNLAKAEWILAMFTKPSGFSQKPSEFSQTLSKAEWILANVYQKPSGFSQMFIKSRVDSRKRLPCFKLLVLNNGPLEFTFLSYFKLPVLNNGPLEFHFVLFQAASPKQRTA
jgi:hypothetical protein